MIRKQTWILLGIFIILAGAAFYLQKNPVQSPASLTPSPTSQPLLVGSWQSSDLNAVSFQDDAGLTAQLVKETNGWVLLPEKNQVAAGKVEELLSQISTVKLVAVLDPTYELTAIGLSAPTKILTLTNVQGSRLEIHIGGKAPTGTGYYVQVNQDAPAVVNSGAIDAIVDLLTMENLLDLTPTPEGTDSTLQTPIP